MAIHWPEPLHHQPADAIDHPAGVTASETVLSLPMSADLSAGDQQRRNRCHRRLAARFPTLSLTKLRRIRP